MIKVLHVLGALNMGGSETMVINLYEKIDNSKIRFDFAVNGTEIGFLEDQIDKNYSQIFRMTKRSDSFVKHLSDFYKIVKKNSYDIIHYHTQNAFLTSVDISVAKLAGVKKNVVHCHSTQDWRTGIVRKLHKPFRPILNRLTTKKIACGEAAASFLYGTTQNVDILPLPVDCDKYLFNQNKRNELRKQYGVEDNIVIAHVGRFSEVKNHGFLIEIFHEFQKLCPNSILFLIGDGELKSKIEEKAKKAESAAKALFGAGNAAEIPAVELSAADFAEGEGEKLDILSLLVKAGLAKSRSEARRAVEQGGVSVNDEKVTDIRMSFAANEIPAEGLVIKKGKKNFKKIVVA